MAAYSRRRTTKKRTTRKRATIKRRSKKTSPRSKAATVKSTALKTDYARAVLDPARGPLVGVPQFVPIDTHRARVKLTGVVTASADGKLDIMFNPCRMVANDSNPVLISTRTAQNTHDETAGSWLNNNGQHGQADFQVPSATDPAITNGDGVRARVVGAVITVTNTSNVQNADGVFIALHEKHHKTVEDFTPPQLAKQSNAIVKRCGSGTSVSLLYRPVKPEEVEEWQNSPWHLVGQQHLTSGTGLDGTISDAYPGYMRICWDGTGAQNFLVTAHAIVEYVGEGVTTLAKPIGGRNPASPQHVPDISKAAKGTEAAAGTIIDPEHVDATLDHYAVIAANEQASTSKFLRDAGVASTRDAAAITVEQAEKLSVEIAEDIATHVDARLIHAASQAGEMPSGGHPNFPSAEEEALFRVNEHLQSTSPEYLRGSLFNQQAVSVSNGGRHVTFQNLDTGEMTIAATGTRFGTAQGARDVAKNWPSIAGGQHADSEFVGALASDIHKARDAAKTYSAMHKTFPRSYVKLTGHSQGGSSIVEYMKNAPQEGIEAVVFNPGVGVTTTQALADIRGLKVHRTHTDLASMMDHFHESSNFKTMSPYAVSDVEQPLLARAHTDLNAHRIASKVKTVGLKGGSRPYKDVLTGGHELKQWHFTDAEVSTSAKFRKFGQVGVKRLPRASTVGKAAGPLAGLLLTGWEVYSDQKKEHSKRDKAAVGVADAALAAAEYFGIGAAALAGGLPVAVAAAVGDMLIHGTAKKYAQKTAKTAAKFVDHTFKKTKREVKSEARHLWRGFKKLFKHKRRPKRNPYKPRSDDIIGHKRGRGSPGGRPKVPRRTGEFGNS